jgi:hypothetical protein
LLTDICSGNFWDLVPDGGGWNSTKHTNLTSPGSYAAFGEGYDGELYVASRSNGQIYHLQAVDVDSWLYLPLILNDPNNSK